MKMKSLIALAMCAVLISMSGCGKSEADIRAEVKAETEALEKQVEDLKKANSEHRKKLKGLLCESMCLDLKQLKEIEDNVPAAAQAEYSAVLLSLRGKLEALGCPPCEE